jgi:two-component system, NtrC family, response regulator AtoC
VRFLAATNRDLEAEVARGRFRADLYYRLNGVSLLLPPLRERAAEIEPLARRFAVEAAERAGRPTPRFDPEALALLRGYDWPGNIRELRNTVERAVFLQTAGVVETEHLPVDRMRATVHVPPPAEPLADPEAERIRAALERCAGSQTLAARELGISLRTLVNRLNRYGLPRPRKGRG